MPSNYSMSNSLNPPFHEAASSLAGKQGILTTVYSYAIADDPEIGPKNMSAYSASKFAVRGIVQSAGK